MRIFHPFAVIALVVILSGIVSISTVRSFTHPHVAPAATPNTYDLRMLYTINGHTDIAVIDHDLSLDDCLKTLWDMKTLDNRVNGVEERLSHDCAINK